MSIPTPERPRTRFEQQRTWIIVSVALITLFVLITIAIRAGIFADLNPFWFGRNLRGYTAFGLTMGVLAVLFTLLTAVYSIRKRTFQERMPRFLQGTMVSWLWSHIYFGIIALVASTLHAGYGLTSGYAFTTGKMLFYVFVLIALTGVIWRLVYRVLPRRVQSKIGNYSDAISIGRAEEARAEIEKLLAGKSADFREIGNKLLLDPTFEPKNSQIDSSDFAQLKALIAKRERGLRRYHVQQRTTSQLQGLRYLHVPLLIAFMGLLVAHIIWVFDFPAKASPAQFGGFHPAENCIDCHAAVVNQWQQSMHAHALTSPVTIVQTNQAVREGTLQADGVDGDLICNNCHAPVGVMLTDQEQATLPLTGDVDSTHLNAGIDCATCHQFSGEPSAGLGGELVYQDDLEAGRTFYGGNDDSVGNSYHQGQHIDRFDAAETTCMSCHNVMLDRNGDGRNEDAGIDLVLQTTYREYEQEYVAFGGQETCLDCHMPILPGNKIADNGDYDAPPRTSRSHSFVGVDYPLDTVVDRDPQLADRTALLQSAALFNIVDETIQLDGNRVTFAVTVDNNQLGHKLPTGFAFARQMWVAVRIVDDQNNLLFESGIVDNNVADLCDTETMADAMAQFVVGCDTADPQLINFQQKLINDVEPLRDPDGTLTLDPYGNTIGIAADDAFETPLQHLTGGAVARVRPSDNQLLARISPDDDERTFLYEVIINDNIATDNIIIEAQLLFRNLPPYFLRALAAGQPADEEPQIAPLIDNLQITEMNSDSAIFSRR